jgi:hypothetical protein
MEAGALWSVMFTGGFIKQFSKVMRCLGCGATRALGVIYAKTAAKTAELPLLRSSVAIRDHCAACVA